MGADIAAIITALGILLTAIGTLWNAIKIHQVHKATNGMVTKLEAVAHKEGKREGIAEERAEHNHE